MEKTKTKENELKTPLKLNLQYFAEQTDGDDDKGADDDAHKDEKGTDEHGASGEKDKADDQKGADDDSGGDDDKYVKMTQEELDKVIQKRLEREREKQERKKQEEQREKDEESGEYKKLYEDLKTELEEERKAALESRKESLLAQAGYSEDQIERYARYLEGEDEGELKESLETLKTDIPPKKQYGDPNPGNGQKTPPKKTNLEDKGKSTYQRLKEKGKIRGKK